MFSLCSTGCRGCKAGPRGAEPSPSGSVVASSVPSSKRPPPPAVLDPLSAPAEAIPLRVPGFGDAMLSVPLGATQPRPLIIALHGNNDRPEWQCRSWRAIAQRNVWVLCPRGLRRYDSAADDPRFTYGSASQTAKELRAALTALKEKFQYYVAPGPVVLAGFSLGAGHAVAIANEEPEFFSRIVLIEGGTSNWSSGVATLFRDRGGKKVLFACGQESCRTKAVSRARLSGLLGIEARVADGGSVVC